MRGESGGRAARLARPAYGHDALAVSSRHVSDLAGRPRSVNCSHTVTVSQCTMKTNHLQRLGISLCCQASSIYKLTFLQQQ